MEKAANITLTLAWAIIILALAIFAAKLNMIHFPMSLINQRWRHRILYAEDSTIILIYIIRLI